MWEGLLGSGTLTDMRSNGRQRLKELLDTSLLEIASEVGKKVKMPNLIRDMALAIASQEFFVKAGNDHANFPVVGALPEGVVRMSFMKNELRVLVLPDSYKFNKLSTLLLQDNTFNLSYHNSLFFNCMRNLKVLNLSHTRFSFLPDSLSNLSNLRALFLRNCLNLSDLPSLSNLNELNVLDLSGTKLEKWPEDMHKLTSLRCLDLTQAKLDIFPAECISSYKQLEELLMLSDINSRGCVWGSNELGDRNGARVEWLPDLGHLADLHLVFLNAMVFNNYMNACPPNGRCAGVESNLGKNGITVIGDHRIVLPKSTSVLNLMNCPDDVRSLSMAGCLRDLTVLDVFALSGLKYLLTLDIRLKEQAPRAISHSSLSELVLVELKKLENVCGGQELHCEKLTKIGVWNCGLLRLPKVLGVRGTSPIEIKGEIRWWDGGAVQQGNPGVSEGHPVNFQVAEIPDELASSPRFTELSDTFLSYPSNDAVT
ncbi:hypothetical protein Ancab_004721, partial [Ancistrocladus abbreviatus]